MTYSVIYADPPWKFKTHSHKGLGRSADAWYDCMTVDEICAMPVESLAAPDCVLLMWVTDPFLRESFRVIDSWGFTFKTVGFYWAKRDWNIIFAQDMGPDKPPITQQTRTEVWSFGTGYWTRANPEQCLLATRGHPQRKNADVPKLIVSPRGAHSAKPEETYERIERLCDGPYIELFARQRRPGWDCLGNETDSGPGIRRWRSDSKRFDPVSISVEGISADDF